MCPTAATGGRRTTADAASSARASVALPARTAAAPVSSQVACRGCIRSESGLARRASSAGSSSGRYTARRISAVPRPAAAQEAAEQLLVPVGQLGDEPGQHRVAVLFPVEHGGQPPGGQAGL